MATYGHISIDKDGEPSSTEKIQKILDSLGAVQGVVQALLVSEEGFPIMCARTTPISDEIGALLLRMIVSTMIIPNLYLTVFIPISP